jgi:hypothetical protein
MRVRIRPMATSTALSKSEVADKVGITTQISIATAD